MYKMFAGGNHSWVVIDDIMPIRENYRPPSPIGAFRGASAPISPRDGGHTPNKHLPKKFDIGIHITYTETAMCHRFVTFESRI